MKCDKTLSQCTCPDIEERLNRLRSCPSLHVPSCIDKPLAQRAIQQQDTMLPSIDIRIQRHLAQMAPHQKGRAGALLLAEALREIHKLQPDQYRTQQCKPETPTVALTPPTPKSPTDLTQ